MPKLAYLLERFTMGETSPLLVARSDLAKYPASCKTMLNFIPLLQGPARRRGGTRFIAKTNNGANPVALIDFAFSETTTYILEVGHKYLRFFYQGAPVMNGSAPYQISTPWTQADLFYDSGICALKYVQSGDVMFIVCPGQPPQKLSRYGHTDWRLEELPGWNTEDATRPNPNAIALWRERLVLAAGQTVYFSQSGAFENFKLVKPGMTWVNIISAPNWPMTVDGATVKSMSPSLGHYVTWSFVPEEVVITQRSNISVEVRQKDPEQNITKITCTLSSSELVFVSDPNKGTLKAEVPGEGGISDIFFDPKGGLAVPAGSSLIYTVSSDNIPVVTDDPMEINVYSEQMDRIEWLCPLDPLVVGTSGGEFVISETTTVDPLGPENIKVSPSTPYGSSPVQALRMGSAVFFLTRSGRKLMQFLFDYTGDAYAAADVTVAAEHITRGGLTCLAWQAEPLEILWAARPDGELVGFSYNREQEMNAWHQHQLGGGGQVSQMAIIPSRHGGRDELWLSVKRAVNGTTVYYIERLEEGHDVGAGLVKDCFFVDSGKTYSGQGLTEITGLEHLEGHEVAILGDGAVQHRQVVSGGRVTLRYAADVVQVGLPFESVLRTVNLEAQMQDGTIQGRIKRFTRVFLRLVESGGGAVMAMTGGQYEMEYRRGGHRMDEAVPLFSGDYGLDWPGGYEQDGVLTVRQDYPLPFVLAAIIADVNVEGKN